MRNKHRFKQELQEVLVRFGVDEYCDLHTHMLAEHLVRWIEDYARQQNVAKDWALSPRRDVDDHHNRTTP